MSGLQELWLCQRLKYWAKAQSILLVLKEPITKLRPGFISPKLRLPTDVPQQDTSLVVLAISAIHGERRVSLEQFLLIKRIKIFFWRSSVFISHWRVLGQIHSYLRLNDELAETLVMLTH